MAALSKHEINVLYERHSRALLLFLTRRTCDAQVALDLMSETFAQALLRRRTFRGEGDEVARAWLFGIARRQLAQYYRRGRVEGRALDRLGLDPVTAPEDELRRVEELAGLEEIRAPLAQALRAVSAEQREALRLRVVEGQPYSQVARDLGVSEQTARARVSRGLRTLRRLLDEPCLEGVIDLD